MTKTKYTIRFVFSPKESNILSRFPGFPKCHRQIFKRKHIRPPIFPTWTNNNNVQSLCLTHRQHKHLFCRPCYQHALYKYAFALIYNNIQEHCCSKSYELKPITRIVHTTSMHKSLMTSFTIHSLPTNNPVDNNLRSTETSSHLVKFVNFQFVFKPNDNLVVTVQIPLTISWNLYPSFIDSEHNKNEFWKRYKRNPNLLLEFQTIKREC